MNLDHLDPDTVRLGKQILRWLDDKNSVLPELGSAGQGRKLWAALMDYAPERGAEFVRRSGNAMVPRMVLEECAAADGVYEYPATLEEILRLCQNDMDKMTRVLDGALRKLSMNNLRMDQVQACVKVMAVYDLGQKGGPYNAIFRSLNHMAHDDLILEREPERSQNVIKAWTQVVNALIEQGVPQQSKRRLEPSALIRATQALALTVLPEDATQYLPITVMIEAGADWRAALDDPRVDGVGRRMVELHPLVRRARLEALANEQASTTRPSPKM